MFKAEIPEVLHATANIEKVLMNVRELLKP